MDYVTFYHVAVAADVPAMKQGIDPGDNSYAQYGQGFYTFPTRDAAVRWQGVRARVIEEPTVIVEIRLRRGVWNAMRKRTVPQESDWEVPDEWLKEYDVLEGRWAPTPDTQAMAGTWQVKFNPHTYHLLDKGLNTFFQKLLEVKQAIWKFFCYILRELKNRLFPGSPNLKNSTWR